MSRMLLSSASTVCLLVIDASSQIMSDAAWSSLAVPLCFVNPQISPSSILNGILNLECAVLPPGIMEAATPEVAVATAIMPCPRIVAKRAL
uniref:Secreted protein n=1 Tax=Triticum urartu TaxID=4572 RepID=A0A8R7QXN1_TRIUA